MITRNDIINTLKERLYLQSYAHALWLEGSDANHTIDEYSDIDFVVDVDDQYEEEATIFVEKTLSDLAEIDYKFVMKPGHPKLRDRTYHLSGTSPYLFIDFCWQMHSRDPQESCFIRGSKIEAPLILFDKSGVIRFKEFDINEFQSKIRARYHECLYHYTQHARVIKYVKRGLYLEAYAYYNKYVLEPIIDLLRMKYTPANTDYYLIHISNHLPEVDVKRLEYFACIASRNDILIKTTEAKEWFGSLCQEVSTKYCLN